MSNRIREIRKQKGLSGPKLAGLLNITPTYLYELELEKKRLGSEIASNIADIFGVSVDYLLGRVENDGVMANEAPEWATSRDKRDFKKMLEEDEPVMFDGVPVSDEDKEKIKRVMEAIFWDAKDKNKKTYGRKKKGD
jgi:transcriptional regulator with XRE-family HTH domain